MSLTIGTADPATNAAFMELVPHEADENSMSVALGIRTADPATNAARYGASYHMNSNQNSLGATNPMGCTKIR